ncbi:unnamed protein product [Nippostrongylus brasiliensis]|uniref:DNA-directed RNA polymerase n=1 Tax=Nippostrongylus brasiliensis TaxID=27835 RepID=A0A0N4YVQ4_NIPBR|nr:unnamed protein product [Nippostrongylus brasiliensis]
MDTKGRVCMYGSVESVIDARITLKKMFSDHGIDDTTTHPPAPSLDRDSKSRSIVSSGGYTFDTHPCAANGAKFGECGKCPLSDVVNQSHVTSLLLKQKLGENSDSVLKIVQRFPKNPLEWPREEQPFAMIERQFLGKMMHPVELRPERGFVNMVPFGMMILRHFFRRIRAKGNYELFKSTGIFDEMEVRTGTKKVFEVISQHAYQVSLVFPCFFLLFSFVILLLCTKPKLYVRGLVFEGVFICDAEAFDLEFRT